MNSGTHMEKYIDKKMRTSDESGAEEQARHGDVFLPVNSYHCLVPETYTELTLHWHTEMEITFIREGSSDYRVGPERFRAAQGDMIIVPPVTLHSALEIPGQTMVSDSLVFHLDYLGASGPDLSASRYLRPLMEGRFHCPVRICENDPDYARILDAFLCAFAAFQDRPPCYELLLKERLLEVIYLLFAQGYIQEESGRRVRSGTRRQLQPVLRYISDHYRERITVTQLADICGFSESYFMNYFKTEVGMSCIRYLNHVRIQEAARELERTSLPVMDIAMENGYDNISYFNRQFRRRFHMTPGEFRRRQSGTL